MRSEVVVGHVFKRCDQQRLRHGVHTRRYDVYKLVSDEVAFGWDDVIDVPHKRRIAVLTVFEHHLSISVDRGIRRGLNAHPRITEVLVDRVDLLDQFPNTRLGVGHCTDQHAVRHELLQATIVDRLGRDDVFSTSPDQITP
ncbi:hypothetical protein D3C85_678310 [compost metagenome]